MGAHLTLVLVVLAQAPPARESSVLLTAAAIEQFPLPLTQVTLELDPYGSQVRLDSPEPLGPAAKALAKSRLCPVVRKRAGGLGPLLGDDGSASRPAKSAGSATSTSLTLTKMPASGGARYNASSTSRPLKTPLVFE